jgi:uncharacterized protein involved in copper resistance
MNTFAIAAAAVLLSAGAAFAQSDTPPAAVPAQDPAQAAPADAPDDAMPGMRQGRPDGMRGQGMKMHPRGGPHGDKRGYGRGHHGGMMMHPSKGASFVFAAPGEGRIMIKCADEDSTQACADAVKPLLEMMLKAGDE